MNSSCRMFSVFPTKIQQWKIDNLPDEDFAVDNGIIMDNSDRWPLMLDP